MTLKLFNLIDDYQKHYEITASKKNYGRLKHFERWREKAGKLTVEKLVDRTQFYDLYTASRQLRSELTSSSYYNKHLSSLSMTFRTARSGELGPTWCKIVYDNPVLSLQREKEPPPPLKLLNKDQIQRLFEECKKSEAEYRKCKGNGNPWIYRFIRLAYITGRRRSELLSIQADDIDIEQRKIVIDAMRTKSKKRNTVIFIDESETEIIELMQECVKNQSLLFYSIRGGTSTITCPKRIFRAVFDRAGLTNHSLHDLRHTARSRLAGMGYADAWKYIGHSSPCSSARYLHESEEFCLLHQKALIESLK